MDWQQLRPIMARFIRSRSVIFSVFVPIISRLSRNVARYVSNSNKQLINEDYLDAAKSVFCLWFYLVLYLCRQLQVSLGCSLLLQYCIEPGACALYDSVLGWAVGWLISLPSGRLPSIFVSFSLPIAFHSSASKRHHLQEENRGFFPENFYVGRSFWRLFRHLRWLKLKKKNF